MAVDPIVTRMERQRLNMLVENEGKLLFASDRPGIEALRTTHFSQPELLDGSDVAVPVVNLAAAYLLILSNAGRVFCRIMSQEARAALDEVGIEHKSGTYTKRMPEKFRAPSASLDARAREAVTPQAFAEDLKRMGV